MDIFLYSPIFIKRLLLKVMHVDNIVPTSTFFFFFFLFFLWFLKRKKENNW